MQNLRTALESRSHKNHPAINNHIPNKIRQKFHSLKNAAPSIIICAFAFLISLTTLHIESTHAATLKKIAADDFILSVHNDDKEYQLLFLFTSWCPFCKRAISPILNIAPEIQAQTNIVLLSIDKYDEQIAEFVAAMPENVVIYHIDNFDDVQYVFKSLHIKYANKIPHYTLLNSKKAVLLDGDVSLDSILQIILN